MTSFKIFTGKELSEKLKEAMQNPNYGRVQVDTPSPDYVIDRSESREVRVNRAIEEFEDSLERKPTVKVRYYGL